MPRDSFPAPILNHDLTGRPWAEPRTRTLPGISPLDPADWLWVGDNYAAQMAERERLLATAPEAVLAVMPGAETAAEELYDMVLAVLEARADFQRDGSVMTCPDGRRVPLDRSAPLATLGRLVQEDLCLLQKPEGSDEHLLTGAILCFPSNWTLAQKIGRPIFAIHRPVAIYGPDLARRVQRLLDGVQPGRPLWRANAHFYEDPSLFRPRREDDRRDRGGPDLPYFRSERQCLLRLPQTRAVVFSIHTLLFTRDALPPEDIALLSGH